ncbi:sugar ABC transporter substrate-binding protein [Methylobacterium sp. SyP6R]|uniref:sugar ABC transporter substrate-binding protein n=1 Tax=Methylobacterium sp. SyP6R TaxID=2718876 RepID=UPI001F27C53A|nr:sugar ABC transporter substrate-binding protein [Methylobacterium sp. SyP6R]MCF4129616.1 sugar ABC transporter substrate-binding protein [Methylobacterium sp. SyP6R]
MTTLRSLMAGAALLALVPFGAHAAEPVKIGLAVANLQADFFNQIKQSVERNAKEMGATVVTVDAKGDGATQVSQIQDLVNQKIQALIYIPAGAAAAAVPVKTAKAAGIPVVAVDRNPTDAPGDTFIATNSVVAAKTLGDYACKVSGGKGELGIIQGQIGTTPEQDRDKGFKEAMATCPGIKEVGREASKMWMKDEGFNIAQNMLQRHPGITMFFGRADALALGAAQAVKAANLGRKIWVFGFDGDLAGLKAVKDGTLDATMTQRTQAMGKLALQSALDLVAGKKVPAEQLQDAALTTKDNAEQYIANHP